MDLSIVIAIVATVIAVACGIAAWVQTRKRQDVEMLKNLEQARGDILQHCHFSKVPYLVDTDVLYNGGGLVIADYANPYDNGIDVDLTRITDTAPNTPSPQRAKPGAIVYTYYEVPFGEGEFRTSFELQAYGRKGKRLGVSVCTLFVIEPASQLTTAS